MATVPQVRRWALIVVVLVLASSATTVLLLGDSSGNIDLGDGTSAKTDWRETKWLLDTISRDQRTLGLAFPSGGCTNDDGRARVDETESGVKITVEAEMPRDKNVSCTLDLRRGRAMVRLDKQLAGRPVLGASRIGFFEPLSGAHKIRGDKRLLLVPRLAGLRAADAVRLLESHDFRPAPIHAAKRNREVLGSNPPFRTPIKRPHHTQVKVLTR